MDFTDTTNDLNLLNTAGGDGGLSERLLDDQHHHHPTTEFDPEVATPNSDFTVHNQDIVVNQVFQGEKQPNQFRDAWAAVLFVGHFITIGYFGFMWGIPSLNYTTEVNDNNTAISHDHHYGGIFSLCILSGFLALFISIGVLSFMTQYAQQLVQGSLLFSIGSDILLTIYFITVRSWIGIIVSVLFLLIAGWYAYTVWRRIPFAAANLETALTCVRTNGGITIVAFGISIFVNIIFMSLWLLAWLGVYVRYTAKACQQTENYDHDPTSSNSCLSHMNPFVIILFLLSYYWTSEVGKNALHVTVSGVVGTWWFAPEEATTFFSPAITDSFTRATTYSAGSICLGSLVTATLQVLYHISREARRHGRSNEIIFCILECISRFLERLVAYFNKWAYVYVGLYGYDYLTSGRKVMDLFKSRGWTTIINDDLVLRVLVLMNVLIGILTGCIGLILSAGHSTWLVEFGSAAPIVAFIVPFIIGLSMSSIVMGVVSSAVDTIIVAFCEAPLEFERNHPGLYRQMIRAWSQIYPEEFGVQQ